MASPSGPAAAWPRASGPFHRAMATRWAARRAQMAIPIESRTGAGSFRAAGPALFSSLDERMHPREGARKEPLRLSPDLSPRRSERAKRALHVGAGLASHPENAGVLQ